MDSRYKFALMQVVNLPPDNTQPGTIDTDFYVLDAAELNDPARHVPYPVETLKALSPEHWALMELCSGADLALLKKCYATFPALSENWLDFRRELHMTGDKDLFIEQEAPGLVPLYEGKMIWQYNHVFEAAQYWLDATKFDKRLRSKELHRMAQDLGEPKARVVEHAAAIRYDREFVRLGFRTVARDTNERTLIFSLLPTHCGSGHSMFVPTPEYYSLRADGQVKVQAVSALSLLFARQRYNERRQFGRCPV